MSIIKYQSGGGIRSQSGIGQPTTADSLALLQNTLAYKKYVQGKNYIRLEDGTYEPDVQDRVYQAVLARTNSKKEFPGIFISNNKVSSWYPIYKYRVNRNPNQYYQRDNQQKIIDLDAPMHLYDRRIKPHAVVNLKHKDANFDERISDPRIGDVINYQEYHPLQVTPFNMLNQKQKIERQKMFGVNPGEPDLISPKPQGAFKKPSLMVYRDVINKITPKGLLTFTQPTPQMRRMPDVVYKDSRQLNAGYTGIDVQHKTDPLGRWAAYMHRSTTPGVRGRISTPNPEGDFKTKFQEGGEIIRGKQYPAGTIVTNDPNRFEAFKDSLDAYHLGLKEKYEQSKMISQAHRAGQDYSIDYTIDYPYYDKNLYPIRQSLVTFSSNNGIPKGGILGSSLAREFKKPITVVYTEPQQSNIPPKIPKNVFNTSTVNSISRMTPKGLPTFIQPTPKLLRMPDRIELDPTKHAAYRGIDVSHYTDALGRYTAKLNLVTKPGVTGRISYKHGGNIPMAQNGLVANKYSEPPQYVFSNTPEYRKLYEEGRVGRYDPVTNTYALPDLKGVEIKSTDQSVAKAVRDSGGQFWRGVGELMSQPQRRMMEGITGKEQYPSEAIGFKDPKGFQQNAANFGMDVIADPLNLLGVGLAKGLIKQPIKNLSKFSPYLSTAKRISTGNVLKSANSLVRKSIQNSAEYLTTKTPLRNAWKLNPYAYKPNAESYYRGIAKTGYDDALKTRVLRSPEKSGWGDRVHTSSQMRIAEQYSQNSRPWMFKENSLDIIDAPIPKGFSAKSYIAEIPRTSLINPNSPDTYGKGFFNKGFHQFVNPKPIPIDDVRLLKQDWWRRYRDVTPKNLIKPASKAVGKTDDVVKPIVSFVDDVNPFKGKYDLPDPYKQAILEEYRLKNLKELNSKEAGEVLENFITRINTPEGKKRMKELGILYPDDAIKFYKDLKIYADDNTYAYYSSDRSRIGMNPELNMKDHVTRHEIEHSVRDVINTQKMNKYSDDVVTTEIDDLLSNLELKIEPESVNWNKIKSERQGKIRDASKLTKYFEDDRKATNYFTSGSEGNEKSAFLGEVQQYMMSTGIIPKTEYINITPEMIKQTMISAAFDEKNNGKYLRLFRIMKPSDFNYDLISKALNKMLSVPAAIGTGAAIQSQNQNTTFRSHKVGGIIKGNSGTPIFNQHPLQPVKITQKKVLPKLNMYQAYQPASETTNRPMVTPSADTILPEPEKPKVQDTVYVVNKGDSLWKIAKEHGTDLDTLKRNNPQIKNIHKIHVGDSVIIKKQLSGTALLPNDYRYKSPFELDELNASTSDIDKLHLYESSTPSSDYYVVEDKKAHTATVYQSGKPIITVNTATGKNKGDDLTVTTTGGRGKDGPIIHGAGNMSTPAGMFRINSTGIYRGNKSFQRSKVYEDYNIASSVHTGNVPSNKEQCNISNGCTRITPEGANQLSKYVGKNTRWYILPEKETTGQFKLTGAGISFISNNIQKLHSEHVKGSRRFSIDVPNYLKDNDDVKAAISVLTERKSKFMDRLQISSDTYDKLSAMALGVMGRESGFNRPGMRGTFGMVRDDVLNLVGKNVSAGPYQLRKTSIPKNYIEDLYGKEVPIAYEDLMNTETSTELTMLTLYDIYKNIAPRYQEKYPDMSLEEITLAYYTNPQGVIDPSKSELRKKYAKDVLAMAKSFRLNYS